MDNSVRNLLDNVRDGDSLASRELYDRFADRIRDFASSRLNGPLNGKVSAEDVVQSVFRSFFRRNRDGQFEFENWNSLWGLLVTMAARKCSRSSQHFKYAKRDVRRESKLTLENLPNNQLIKHEPSPEEVVILQDAVEWSLEGLNQQQQDIVLLRLTNYSTMEIGEMVGRTERTVRRVLEKFRSRIESQL